MIKNRATGKMIDISVNEIFTEFVNPELLRTTATMALQKSQSDDPTGLTIAIENDELLRSLNLQFLGIDAPTDVLSFPADETDPETGNRYLGDIIISFPRAKFKKCRLILRNFLRDDRWLAFFDQG
jgi:probable rRNA maturation factor